MTDARRFEQPDQPQHPLEITGVPYGPMTPKAAEVFDVEYSDLFRSGPLGRQVIADLHPDSSQWVVTIEYGPRSGHAEAVGLAQAVVAELAGDTTAMASAGGFQGIHWVGHVPETGDAALETLVTDPTALANRLSDLFDPYEFALLISTHAAAARSPAFQQFCRALLDVKHAGTDDAAPGRRLFVVEMPSDDYPAEDLIQRALFFGLRSGHRVISISRFNENAAWPYVLDELLPHPRGARRKG